VNWRRLDLWIVLAAASVAPAPAQSEHQHHPPQSSDEYARVLNDPKRDAWQLPHEVIVALNLRKDESIADIGAGTGYFSKRFARHAGTVFAVDVDAKLLRLASQGAPENLKTVLAGPDDPRLAPQSVDTIFFCDVLHHIEKREAYYPKLAKALKPGGRIVVIDFHKKESPVGPPLSMRMSKEEVEGEFSRAGFTKAGDFDLLPYQYFVVFERR
jgi:ubiquinone/menaquinone biosynthesis C-methylase UbiE